MDAKIKHARLIFLREARRHFRGRLENPRTRSSDRELLLFHVEQAEAIIEELLAVPVDPEPPAKTEGEEQAVSDAATEAAPGSNDSLETDPDLIKALDLWCFDMAFPGRPIAGHNGLRFLLYILGKAGFRIVRGAAPGPAKTEGEE